MLSRLKEEIEVCDYVFKFHVFVFKNLIFAQTDFFVFNIQIHTEMLMLIFLALCLGITPDRALDPKVVLGTKLGLATCKGS